MELLAEEAERTGLLSDSKNGCKRPRSTIDAAANIINRAHTAKRYAHIADIHLMDIMADYLCIRRGRLIHTV